jgi:hypothetical protein
LRHLAWAILQYQRVYPYVEQNKRLAKKQLWSHVLWKEVTKISSFFLKAREYAIQTTITVQALIMNCKQLRIFISNRRLTIIYIAERRSWKIRSGKKEKLLFSISLWSCVSAILATC